MTTSSRDFSDISDLTFSVPQEHAKCSLVATLVFERGTRSYSGRMFQAGRVSYADLQGVSVSQLLDEVPTTRPNFDRVLSYLTYAGIKLG